MGIKNSIYYRLKSLLKKEELKNIASKYNIGFVKIKDSSFSDIESMETIINYLKNTNILIDIGAHKGLFTKTANSFFPFDKTICFEPNKVLHNTIKENNSNINLIIENMALSDKEGKATFHLHQDSSMNSIEESNPAVLKSEFPWDNPDLIKKMMVTTKTLDNYFKNPDFKNNLFFIKIDTQGNELNVLKHGIQVLKKTKVLLIEYMFLSPYKNESSFSDLIYFLNEHNFICKGALTIFKRPSKKISGVDFLFIKK
jgi:FkbM family methyltransferase